MDRKQKNTVILGASLAAVVIAAAVLYSSLSGKYAPSGASVLSAAPSQAESSASSAQQEDPSGVSSQAVSSASSAETSSASASSGTASAAESSAAESSSGAASSETPASSSAQSVSSGEPASSGQAAASKAPASSAAQGTSSQAASSGTASAAPSSAAQSGASENAAPDFTVYDASGKTVKFSDFRGKPVVLNFWASWCYYCKEELPDFADVYSQDKDKVQFLFVNWTDGYRETQAIAENYLKQAGYSLPVYYDLDQDAATKYGLTGIPATVFIYSDGSVAGGYSGMIDRKTLESGIAEITG